MPHARPGTAAAYLDGARREYGVPGPGLSVHGVRAVIEPSRPAPSCRACRPSVTWPTTSPARCTSSASPSPSSRSSLVVVVACGAPAGLVRRGPPPPGRDAGSWPRAPWSWPCPSAGTWARRSSSGPRSSRRCPVGRRAARRRSPARRRRPRPAPRRPRLRRARRRPTPSATPFAPRTVASGEFRGTDDFHFGSGTASIVEVEPGRFHLRLEDFSVRNGPDLYVYLSPAADGWTEDALELGRSRRPMARSATTCRRAPIRRRTGAPSSGASSSATCSRRAPFTS